MAQTSKDRIGTYAVCNTGPLISAFQSDSFSIFTQIFTEIHLSKVCVSELIRHGWEAEVQAATPPLAIVSLTVDEEQRAYDIAEQIALHPHNNDPIIENHLGEALTIAHRLFSKCLRWHDKVGGNHATKISP